MDDLTAGAVSQLNQLSLETVDAADFNVSEINFTELQGLAKEIGKGNEDLDIKVMVHTLRLVMRKWVKLYNDLPDKIKSSCNGKWEMQYLEEKQATLARITDKLESKSVLKELSNHLLVVVQRVLELDLEGEKTKSEAIFSSVLIRCVHDKNPTGILIIENYSSICTSERGKRCAEGDTCRCRIL